MLENDEESHPLMGSNSPAVTKHQKRFSSVKLKCFKVVFTLFVIIFICMIFTYHSKTDFIPTVFKGFELITDMKYEGSEDICLHPKIDFFDPEIMEFYKNYSKPFCKVDLGNLTFLDEGKHLLINTAPDKYDCWGRCQNYKTNRNTEVGKWYNTNETYNFGCDIVETRCSNKGQNISHAVYFYIHSQIIELPPEKPKFNVTGKQYDVYFFVVDSLSYTQMYRNLNKTNNFLLEELEGVPFPYVNRVGLTSRPNGFAWFYGKLTETINRTMYNLPSLEPEPNWAFDKSCSRRLDDENMLLAEFRDHGYMTNHVADWFRTVDYGCAGVEEMITDHSYTTYSVVYNANPDLYTFLEKKQCLQRHESAIEYFDKFVNSYLGKAKMAFMWLSWVGHNNEPDSSDADSHFIKLFTRNKKIFDNSFVFFAGDHGLRFSEAAKTKLGMYDVNNPMLLMTIPKELRKNSELVETLKRNAGELQTHFDTRATLLDILKFQPGENFKNRTIMQIPEELGYSFLREQKQPRTCMTLPIPPELCICESPVNTDILAKNPSRANSIGRLIIERINDRLENNGVTEKCRKWTFEKTSKLLQVSSGPFANFQGTFVAWSSNNTTKAEFFIFLGGKSDASVDIHYLDRLDQYGEKGNCVKKLMHPVCDCLG